MHILSLLHLLPVFRRLLPGGALLAGALFYGGCSTTLARIDQHNLRDAMMRYEEDQIMDNLIRTYECLPVVQFDIKTMDAKVSTELGSSLSGGQTITNAAAGFLNVTRPIAWALTPKRNNDITVSVEPVENANEVYEAYTYFVQQEQGLTRVESGQSKPKEGVLIGRTGGPHGLYYYVSDAHAEAFRKLALRVTVARGSIEGAASPLDLKPSAKGGSLSKRRKLTPLDAPAVTSPLDRNHGSLDALRETASELRKLRLLR